MRPSLSKTNIERGTQATKEPVAQCCGARRPDVARNPPSDGKLSVSYQGWDQSKTVLPSRRSATCFRAATIFLKVDQTLDWYVTRARDGPWCRKSVLSVLAAPPRRAWFEAAAAINFMPHTGGTQEHSTRAVADHTLTLLSEEFSNYQPYAATKVATAGPPVHLPTVLTFPSRSWRRASGAKVPPCADRHRSRSRSKSARWQAADASDLANCVSNSSIRDLRDAVTVWSLPGNRGGIGL